MALKDVWPGFRAEAWCAHCETPKEHAVGRLFGDDVIRVEVDPMPCPECNSRRVNVTVTYDEKPARKAPAPAPPKPGELVCPRCESLEVIKAGKARGGGQKLKCKRCQKLFLERSAQDSS